MESNKNFPSYDNARIENLKIEGTYIKGYVELG